MNRFPIATALLAALLLAVCLSACGGGEGSSGGASTSTGTGTATVRSATPPRQGTQQPDAAPHRHARSTTGASQQAAPPSAAARQFQTRGGDNSIQEFGGEGGGSELKRAAAALHGYLDARAAEEWKKACGNMAAGIAKSLQQLGVAASGQGGKASRRPGCPQLLAAMSAPMPAYVKKDTTQAAVGALRVEGQRGFLLFHGAHHANYFMPMAREGGRWKVAAIAASALP